MAESINYYTANQKWRPSRPESSAVVKYISRGCFHGSADHVAPAKNMREMIARLRAEGGTLRYPEYPEMGHGIWDKVYHSAELYFWLLQQHQE